MNLPSRSPSDFKYKSNEADAAYEFTKNQFKEFIRSTYNDWYFDRNDPNWEILDFLEVVAKNKYDVEFGPYLVDNDKNILTYANMPSIDLGDKPASFGPNRPESE